MPGKNKKNVLGFGVSIKTISSSILCVLVNSKSTPVKASARLQGDGKDETGSAIIRIFLQ